MDYQDAQNTTLSFIRKTRTGRRASSWPCSTSRRSVRRNYRVGVPRGGFWREILNSDAREYGGSGQGNFGGVAAEPVKCHCRPFSLTLTLPPLAAVLFINRNP